MEIVGSACRYGFTACRKPTQRTILVLLDITPPSEIKKRNLFPRRRLPIV
jgi:hypothetical protein